jgi:tRNA pseudouridine55 synthase
MTTPPRTRVPRRPVHGVLWLNKPIGLSSNDALQKAKWLLRAEKAGHTGTLDPLATGVLPLTFGCATKFSQVALDAPKQYRAVARLGQTTRTGDAEGEVLSTTPITQTPAQLQRLLDTVLPRFRGNIAQVPPMHSALKREGRALYEYARAGQVVERAARDVQVYELYGQIAPYLSADAAMHLIATVSKGTYIRTLAEDIGAAMGLGAHLMALERTATLGHTLADCVTLADLEAMDDAQRLAQLQPPTCLLQAWPIVQLESEHAARFLTGLRRRGTWPVMPHCIVNGPAGELLGTAHVARGDRTDTELIAQRLLSPLEVQQCAAQFAPKLAAA